MIENVSTQLTVFHCFAHCLLPGRAFASLYALLFLEKEAEIGGRVISSVWYSECSKILNIFLILFSNKMLLFRARIHTMFVRIANSEDPDQTAS